MDKITIRKKKSGLEMPRNLEITGKKIMGKSDNNKPVISSVDAIL